MTDQLDAGAKPASIGAASPPDDPMPQLRDPDDTQELTPEQRSAYETAQDAILAERLQRMMHRGGGPTAATRCGVCGAQLRVLPGGSTHHIGPCTPRGTSSTTPPRRETPIYGGSDSY
jgi:hypothetical protein